MGIGARMKLVKTSTTHVYPELAGAADDVSFGRGADIRASIGSDAAKNCGPSVEDFAICPADVNRCVASCPVDFPQHLRIQCVLVYSEGVGRRMYKRRVRLGRRVQPSMVKSTETLIKSRS